MRYRYTGNVSIEQIRWGGNRDPRNILKTGKEYEVDFEEVHSWHTRIFLVGYDGYFNSVWFEPVELLAKQEGK